MKASCPNEETLADYVEGRLEASAVREIDQHLRVCDQCMEDFLVSSVMVRGGGGASLRPVPPEVTRRALLAVENRDRALLPAIKHKLANIKDRILSAADDLKRLNLLNRPVYATVRNGSGTEQPRSSRISITIDNDTIQIEVEWTLHHTAVIKITGGKNASRGIPIRVTVKRDDREIASQLLTQGYAVFEDLGAGRYEVVFLRNGRAVTSWGVDIKETQP